MKFDYFSNDGFFNLIYRHTSLSEGFTKQISDTYLRYLNKASENFRFKKGDFYDYKNNIYYTIKYVAHKGKFLIPALDQIDTSINTISIFESNDKIEILIINNGSLIYDVYSGVFYLDGINTKYYDNDSLRYVIDNNLLNSYDDFNNLDQKLEEHHLKPDIEFFYDKKDNKVFRIINGNTESKKLDDKDILPYQYKQICDLDSAIKEYKQKVKSIFT